MAGERGSFPWVVAAVNEFCNNCAYSNLRGLGRLDLDRAHDLLLRVEKKILLRRRQ